MRYTRADEGPATGASHARMNLESNYGSSEYSQEAEELFARYLLDLEAGTAAEFEDFCAEHDEQADELYGLHADWDNVRGLLSRLENQRPKPPVSAPVQAAAAPEVAASSKFAATDADVSLEEASAITGSPMPAGDPPASRARGTNKSFAAVGIVVALGLGIWSWSLLRDREVLAEEKHELTQQSERVEAELSATRVNSDVLARAKSQLERDLGATQVERDEVRERFKGLSRDLDSERELQVELTEQRQKLEQELETERARQAQADKRLQLAETRAQVLAAQLTAEVLKSREAQLWPTTAAILPGLRDWLADANALSSRIQAPLSLLKSAQPSEPDLTIGDAVRGLETAMNFLQGATGLIERCRKRLALIEAWQELLAGADAQAWQATLERLRVSPQLIDIDWEPQLGLVPLGVDSASGLLRFADRQTGAIPAQDAAGELLLDDESALVFALVPGIELEGQVAPAFLVSLNEWTPARRARALLRSAAPNAEVDDAKRYQLDLERVGYEAISSLRVRLAQDAGLRAKKWAHHPVRPLRLE